MSKSVSYANNAIKLTNEMNAKIINTNSIKNPQMYSSAISTAVKMLGYKTIAPAPPTMSSNDYKQHIAPTATVATATITTTSTSLTTIAGVGVKTRKYTPRAIISNTNNNNNISINNNQSHVAPYSVDQTQSVQRRNARERNRVKQVNNSFARLRQHLPQYIVSDMTKGGGRGPHKKISKVDTLRIAVEYIRRLEYLVEDLGGSDCLSTSSEGVNESTTPNTSNVSPTMQSQIFYSTSSPNQQKDFQQLPLPLPLQQSHQLPQCFSSALLTPISLGAFSPGQTTTTTKIDVSCHSPTASYISNNSFDSGTYEPAQQLSPEPFCSDIAATPPNNANNLSLKFEPYDNFKLDEEDCTPDDDEIIDYISLWQEEQQQQAVQH